MNVIRCAIRPLSVLIALFSICRSAAVGQQVVGSIALGNNPVAAVIDPVLNKIYVVNNGSNNVTAIDEFANTSTSIAVGNSPSAVALNPATGRLYVANTADATVTVIDGGSNSVLSTIKVGRSPVALAVNTVTDKVYVANRAENTVSIIDGATSAISTVAVGLAPVAIAVNPADSTVYIANQSSSNVTVLSETDGSTTTFAVGEEPAAIAVEPTTDTVYVVNNGDGTVTAANQQSGNMTTFSVGAAPASIAINPVTNEIYVPSAKDDNVTVIDGASGATTTVSVGLSPKAIALDSISNNIYVANSQVTGATSLVSVIDGATNKVTKIAGSGSAASIAVDPKSSRVYVPEIGDSQAIVIEEASNSTATISVGTYPRAIAFDPATGTLFICNYGSGSVSIVDTASNAVTTVPTGTWPIAVGVNPVTNLAYVVNELSATISVIDGASKAVTQTIPIPFSNSSAVTVDPVANKVYVALSDENELMIVDGATNGVSSLPVGEYPVAVAVNPVTNTIYVLNESGNSVSAIDGATMEITATIGVPTSVALEVNPNTNKIYVAGGAETLTVIDGATNRASTVQLKTGPNYGSTLAINRQTNRVYVSGAESASSSTVVVINGASDTVLRAVTVSAPAGAFAINPITDQIYSVTGPNKNDAEAQPGVIDIDGATDTPVTIPLPSMPASLAVDPVSGEVYATGTGDTAVTILTPNVHEPIPLTTALSGVPDNQTMSTTNVFQTRNLSPVFTAQVTSSYSSLAPVGLAANPAPSAVYYEVDGGANPWTRAAPSSTNSGGATTFSLCLSNIPLGLHTLYAFSSYGDESAESGPGNGTGNAPQIGNIAAVEFLIEPGGTARSTSASACASTQPPPGPTTATTTTLSANVNPQTFGSSVTFTAAVSPASGSGAPTGTVTFFEGTTQLGSATLGSNLTAAYSTSSLAVGSHSFTAAYGGDSTFMGSTSSPLTETIVKPAPIATTITVATSANPQTLAAAVTFTATVNPSLNLGFTSGTVSFFDGASLLGTSSLSTALAATFSSSSLTLGDHSISATYSGDTNYAGSTSQVLVESIVSAPANGDFALTANPASLVIAAGKSGTAMLTVSPVNGFQGAVSLACDDVPSNITCVFQSPTVNVNSASPLQTVLTLRISQNSLTQPRRNGRQDTSLHPWFGCFLPILGFGAAFVPRRRGIARARWMLFVAALAIVLDLGGCGVTFNGYPSTYKFLVSASANSGTLKHQTTLSVTVQQ